jgi:hypothetical protein
MIDSLEAFVKEMLKRKPETLSGGARGANH